MLLKNRAHEEEGEVEPVKFTEIEVVDIDIQYPHGVLVALTLREDKGDLFRYSIVGGQTCLYVNQGSSESIFHLNPAFYHAFRKRIIKLPEPKFVPPSALPVQPALNTASDSQ
jgi:hypothetical protein